VNTQLWPGTADCGTVATIEPLIVTVVSPAGSAIEEMLPVGE
jgi:hypothetical protein